MTYKSSLTWLYLLIMRKMLYIPLLVQLSFENWKILVSVRKQFFWQTGRTSSTNRDIHYPRLAASETYFDTASAAEYKMKMKTWKPLYLLLFNRSSPALTVSSILSFIFSVEKPSRWPMHYAGLSQKVSNCKGSPTEKNAGSMFG